MCASERTAFVVVNVVVFSLQKKRLSFSLHQRERERERERERGRGREGRRIREEDINLFSGGDDKRERGEVHVDNKA